jgi:indole-3-glycerol phosphate synthase
VTTVLDRIVSYKREDVARRRASTTISTLESRVLAASKPRGFVRALKETAKRSGWALICEIKKASPSKGLIRADFAPAEHAAAYESGGAACLSVLTDEPSFQGSDDYLAEAHGAAAIPILRKDFIVDPWQVLETRALGADAALLIMACSDDHLAKDVATEAERLGLDLLVEVHNRAELDRALTLSPKLIGVNNRDLHTFEVSLKTSMDLSAYVPQDVTLVSESGLYTREELTLLSANGFSAFLIGESLMRQADIAAATRLLA